MMYGTLCTEFYDADKKFATAEEIKFYISIFEKNQRILEPMCGSGRLLIPLMQEGYVIHGIDNSPHMLKSCIARANQLGLNPIVFESDLESIPIANKYDGVIIPFGSFQLLYPRQTAFKMLEKFKLFLKPGGKLVMDLFVPWDALYENNQDTKSHREIQIDNKTKIRIDDHSIANKEEQWIKSTTVYTKFLDQEIVNTETEHMNLVWFYRYEMELILEKYGFKKIQCHNRFFNNENLMTFVAEIT